MFGANIIESFLSTQKNPIINISLDGYGSLLCQNDHFLCQCGFGRASRTDHGAIEINSRPEACAVTARQIPCYGIGFEQVGRTDLLMLPIQASAQIVHVDGCVDLRFGAIMVQVERHLFACGHGAGRQTGKKRFQSFDDIERKGFRRRVIEDIPDFEFSRMLSFGQCRIGNLTIPSPSLPAIFV